MSCEYYVHLVETSPLSLFSNKQLWRHSIHYSSPSWHWSVQSSKYHCDEPVLFLFINIYFQKWNNQVKLCGYFQFPKYLYICILPKPGRIVSCNISGKIIIIMVEVFANLVKEYQSYIISLWHAWMTSFAKTKFGINKMFIFWPHHFPDGISLRGKKRNVKKPYE